MRYILDDNGYIEAVSCTEISCSNKSCTEYTGTIPSGYDSLEDWAQNANIRAYKIVNKNLTLDSAKDAELTALYEQELENNTLASRGWVTDKIDEVTSQSGHTHSNKSVLDGITAAKVTSWDNKLSTIPSEYITESELTAKKYLTSIPSEYITETELNSELEFVYGSVNAVSDRVDVINGVVNDNYNNIETLKTDSHKHSNKTVLDGITSANITSWNNKSTFSGNYNDLTNKPTIPTVPTKVSAFTNDAGYLTSVPSEYVTDTELNAKGYLTEHQTLKTINGNSLIGTGDITIEAGGGGGNAPIKLTAAANIWDLDTGEYYGDGVPITYYDLNLDTGEAGTALNTLQLSVRKATDSSGMTNWTFIGIVSGELVYGTTVDYTAYGYGYLGVFSNTVRTDYLKTINGQSLVGTGDITISGGGSSAAQPVAYNVTGAATSVSSASNKTIAKITIPAGLYVMNAHVSFAANTTGVRKIYIGTTENSYANTRALADTRPASSHQATMSNINTILAVETQTTYYLNVYQNSGSSLSCSGSLRALRVGDYTEYQASL